MKKKEDGRFNIVRYYFKEGKSKKIMATGKTWEQVQKHCNDPKTSKPFDWFDGFEQTS